MQKEKKRLSHFLFCKAFKAKKLKFDWIFKSKSQVEYIQPGAKGKEIRFVFLFWKKLSSWHTVTHWLSQSYTGSLLASPRAGRRSRLSWLNLHRFVEFSFQSNAKRCCEKWSSRIFLQKWSFRIFSFSAEYFKKLKLN